MAIVHIRMPLLHPHDMISFECRPCGVIEPGPRRFEGDAVPRADDK
ncbi:MAG: hypothetical protein KJZ73_05520 [Pseudorhodoplanes sp.]|nr:hypothetical protein [Pseudorhodoplanes sp.]MBW7950604.1 hypothetical protein [Pseudorhodoplanes sp.]MCL4710688.1 hypothetical protein [Pseudorhodoplanes sp.]